MMTKGMYVGLSVVIPVRNGANTLSVQLAALASQSSSGQFEIIIVDDGSVDETLSVANEWLISSLVPIRIISSPKSRGVGAARNRGVKAARFGLVAFCDADDMAGSGWIAAMRQGLMKADVVGGALEIEELNSPRVRSWQSHVPKINGLALTLSFLPYAIGASLGTSKAVWESLGGFDENISGHEDVDFCWRAHLNGFSVSHVSDAVMNYRLRSSLSNLARQRYRYGLACAELYDKHRTKGVPSPALGHIAAIWWSRVVLRVPRAAFQVAARGMWVYDVSWLAGCAVGTIRVRALVPVD